jgi:glycosyltransferase involved in cell wall biosynthesis
MRLTVLNVGYPLAPVGPGAVGGAEQVLSHLDVALTRAGHCSIVVAPEGSVVAGTLVATPAANGTLTDEVRRQMQRSHRHAIERALDRWPVDIAHMHGVDFHAYLPPPGVPVLVTLHLPPTWYPPEVFRPARPRTYLHCVSAAQRRACPPGAALLPDIENGVPIEAYGMGDAERRFALMLGRICPEKGFHLGLDASATARTPALLAGEVFRYEAHERYFRQEIVPRLDGLRRFIGPVGLARKRRLLAGARCLLVPSLAPETSSLVAMEALASGTPVIAFPAGALPDIVEHGKTGYIVGDARAMAEAIQAAYGLAPEVCKETARRRFALETMIARYCAVYRELAGWDGCPVRKGEARAEDRDRGGHDDRRAGETAP